MGNRRQLNTLVRGQDAISVNFEEQRDASTPSDCDELGTSHSASSLDELVGLDGPWTEINAEDVAVQTSYVSESMYLVLEDPSSKLLTGERIIAKAHALGSHLEKCGDLKNATPGTLFLTNHRILFAAFGNTPSGLYSPANRPSPSTERLDFSLDVPLCSIASVKGYSGQDVDAVISIMEVTTKSFFRLRFGFPYDCSSSEVFQRLRKLRQRDASVFAFQGPSSPFIPDRAGWRCYDPMMEYQRQGLIPPSSSCSSRSSGNSCPIGNGGTSPFRVTRVNEDFSLCPTYPRVFAVPASVSDEDLKEVAKFRINSRLPAITYLHRQTGATISRCSQPLVGLRRARSTKDEAYFLALKEATRSQKLCIMDCRNQTSAFANLAMGAGFESSANYGNADVIFMGIENIHSVRDSYRRVFELVQKQQENQWLSNLESTRWLEHLRSLLVATARIVELVALDGVSVVCHCSDGWDRTTQVASLAKMMMDPFYRTLRGFQVLVEQEWCSFGHRFADRYGIVDRPATFWEDEDCSPIFAQFLDAVWQLMQQFPCAFEFNSRYLIALMDALLSGRAGTFFGNCEQDREKTGASSRSLSVWTLIHHDRKKQEEEGGFLNPYYAKPGSPNDYGGVLPRVLHPDCHPASINIWAEFYLRQRYSEADLDGRQKKALDLRRKCNALAGAKATLQMQLKRTKEQLEEEKNEKQTLLQELQKLQVEKKNLRKALAGQVCGDARGVVVQEEEDEDSVLVTVATDPSQGTTEQITRESFVSRQRASTRKPALRFSAVGFQMLKSYFAAEEGDDHLDSSDMFSSLSLGAGG